MSIFSNKRCHEIGPVMEYVEARLHGRDAVKPSPEYGVHKKILDEFTKMLDNEAAIAAISDKLLQESTKLSSFDVEMTFLSDEISGFAEEMMSVSETNMAMVEETTASMNQVNESISLHSTTLKKLLNNQAA